MNHLVALTPTDLATAQHSLIEWCDQRINHWICERKEAHEAHAHAVSHKWKSEPFLRLMKKADRRIGFYRKVRAALDAGYLIVPNFPMQIFAIRTTKTDARYEERNWNNGFEQKHQRLEQGKGEYKSSMPLVFHETRKRTDDKEGTEKVYYPGKLRDEIEIPAHLVKPQIMQAVDRARALRLFDSIGIVSDQAADPIVCGQIESEAGWGSKRVTFFLAWFVDLDKL